MMKLTNICPNCFLKWESDKFPLQCLQCNSNKIISHKELNNLNIAHLDCDSFYASIEKRDNQKIKVNMCYLFINNCILTRCIFSVKDIYFLN